LGGIINDKLFDPGHLGSSGGNRAAFNEKRHASLWNFSCQPAPLQGYPDIFKSLGFFRLSLFWAFFFILASGAFTLGFKPGLSYGKRSLRFGSGFLLALF
jgi:hypothetical protein